MCDYTAIVSKVKCNECAQECKCFECDLYKNGNFIESCMFDTLADVFVAITKKINEEEKKSYGNGMDNKHTEVEKHLKECCKAKVKLTLELAWIKVKKRTITGIKETMVQKVVIKDVSCTE